MYPPSNLSSQPTCLPAQLLFDVKRHISVINNCATKKRGTFSLNKIFHMRTTVFIWKNKSSFVFVWNIHAFLVLFRNNRKNSKKLNQKNRTFNTLQHMWVWGKKHKIERPSTLPSSIPARLKFQNSHARDARISSTIRKDNLSWERLIN